MRTKATIRLAEDVDRLCDEFGLTDTEFREALRRLYLRHDIHLQPKAEPSNKASELKVLEWRAHYDNGTSNWDHAIGSQTEEFACELAEESEHIIVYLYYGEDKL